MNCSLICVVLTIVIFSSFMEIESRKIKLKIKVKDFASEENGAADDLIGFREKREANPFINHPYGVTCKHPPCIKSCQRSGYLTGSCDGRGMCVCLKKLS